MKRLLVFVLTLSMILSLVAVPVSATTVAPNEVEIDGVIVVLDHVFEVTVPTQAVSFIADPEGVMGTAGDSAGDILFTNGTLSFINRSSAAIQLGVEARITTTSGDTGVTVTDGNVGTAGDTTKLVRVTATPSTANVAEPTVEFAGEANATPLALTPTLLTFAVPAAEFDIEGTAAAGNLRRVISSTPNLQGTQVQLAGNLTPNPAIWTGNEDFGIRVRFSFIQAPVALPGTAMIGSAHLRQIQTNTEVFNTLQVGPVEPSANATFGGTGNRVLTLDATGFEFPTGTYTVRIVDTRSGTLTTVSSATVTRVNATQVTVGLVEAWAPGGSAQQAGVATRLVLSNGGYTVTVYRANAGTAVVTNVAVVTP